MSESPGSPLRLPDDVYAIVPMRNVVLFPHVLLPISVGREKSIAALEHALQAKVPLGIVLQRDIREDEPARAGLHDVGTLASVTQASRSEDGLQHALCQGLQRIRIIELVDGYPFMAARVERPIESGLLSTEAEALGLQLRERAVELLSLLPGVPAELSHALTATRSSSQLADIVANLIDIDTAEKQLLLEVLAIEARLERLLGLVTHRIEVLRLSHEIEERTKEQIDDRKRDFLLREQMRAIQEELGEDGALDEELEQLDKAITEAAMPAETEAQVRKELKRLHRLAESSGEGGALRSWIDWMIELPWREPQPLAIDLQVARAVLEAEHFGLDKVKRRVIEYLAVKKLNPQGRAPILCLAGPPGVGKTSLGQSIARAVDRPFVRVSLGGVHDEAEMRGHRRTYIGALPGHIIQGLRKAGARDCVMMLDEVDKMSASSHGDPTAALLEILDPEQNGSFRDNYLGVPFDLSRVMFLCTANVIDYVTGPVRDRMELIELPGYTPDEKLQIAQAFLMPRQRSAAGLADSQCSLTVQALVSLVEDYTREAGVRQLEREIGRVMRHAALAVAEGDKGSVVIGVADLDAILGPARYEHDVALRTGLPGVATGLAWTPVGGDILFIEAMRTHGSGKLILTGQLGDVMKESAQAALTLVKAQSAALGIGAGEFEHCDVHVHVPEGAVPKDGPSAGVAMFVALASLFRDRAVRPDLAMTGEISLRGLVLPVGGIKEKVLAAQRAGIRRVLLPARNLRDLREVPASVREAMSFEPLESVSDAVQAALEPLMPR
ncbi:endopeptidase La [Mitsuaria sp. WAJ17]|uniref:endopeptidase La n=1 Tax=Mitsuaria sp. WAJ17 TaxID=2761452 RepID=UPI0015FEEE67|nr:endopeptidase La [Mitsuaria sp. WAJ17]MBB2487479.1 endopeptidase La [Mitsuaria sp. WAJ17]